MQKKNKIQNIYLDHSATTPVDPRVLKEMLPFFSEKFGNYSSLHGFGRESYFAVEKARKSISDHLGCSSEEVIFTSGATESNNLAIKGIVEAIQVKKTGKIHVITTKTEHDAILEPCSQLEKKGVDVTYLPVQKNGAVNLNDVINTIKENTVLISIIFVNNETGVINPIAEISKKVKKINKEIYIHTDATQALNFLPCNVKDLGVDMMSISGHKIYGPKGVGAFFIKKGTPIDPLQSGGHQERSIRSGTINVAGVVGMGKAVELIAKEQEKNNKKIEKIRNYFVKKVFEKIPNIILNTDLEKSVISHANFCFPGAEGEAILLSLDIEGVAVSTGSACASGSLEPSHVLLAMGIEKEVAHSSIRFTFGKSNTKEEADYVLGVLPGVIEKLRKMNPLYNK